MENIENETAEAKPTPAGAGEGDQPKTNTKIDDANLAAKRMEDATQSAKEQNDRAEQIAIDRKLGGETEAGVEAEEPTKLTDAEAASRKRIKAVGLAGGAQWAKKMDKEDGAK